MSENDEALIRPVERMPAAPVLDDDDPAPVEQVREEVDPDTDHDAPEAVDGDEQPRRTMTAEEKLKRKNTEAKRLRRELAARDRAIAEMAQRMANVEAKVSQVDVQALLKAEADTTAEVETLETLRAKALEEGNTAQFSAYDKQLRQAERKADQIAAAKQQMGRQYQQRQTQQTEGFKEPGWVADWRDQNRWYGKDPEATQDAFEISRRLKDEGVSPESIHHRRALDAELRQLHPHLFQQRPPRSGQAVAGGPRGGALSSGAKGSIPPLVEAQLRRSGHNLDDPKVRADYERRFGSRWKNVPRGA